MQITNDEELRSPERIRKLARERAHVSYLTVIAFVIMGTLCFGVAVMLLMTRGFLPSVIMIMMTATCFLAAKLFHRETQIDPVRNFLKRPEEFEFTTCLLTSAHWHYDSHNRRGTRMVVRGEGQTLQNEPLLFFENFAPDIWDFSQDGEYFKPVRVHVIYHKRHRHAALVGIDKNLLTAGRLRGSSGDNKEGGISVLL